jgi:hypothetical protein
MTPKFMNKKTFAASLSLPKTTFERRSILIDCVLPSGLLSEEMREEWLKKSREWDILRLEEKRKNKIEAK